MSSPTVSKASAFLLMQIILMAIITPSAASKLRRLPTSSESCTSSSTCPNGQFCKFEDGACNGSRVFAALTGICTELNFRCTKIFRPVCGCDNETYANSCLALSHGVSIMAYRTCEDEEEGET